MHLKDAGRTTTLNHFHPTFRTKIVADASKEGLGAISPEKNRENSVLQPVVFASCSLLEPETIYSQTEREALSGVFSCVRRKNYKY